MSRPGSRGSRYPDLSPIVDALEASSSNDDAVVLRSAEGDAERLQAFIDRDLASMGEGFRGLEFDAFPLTAEQRASVVATLPPGWVAPTARQRLGERLLVLHEGAVIGTVALMAWPHQSRLHVSSLYVDPDYRGRGVARQVLDRVQAAASLVLEEAALELSTEWTWFHPVIVYLRLGFWLRLYKRGLTLVRGGGPVLHLDLDDPERIRLVVERDGERTELAHAWRQGDELGWWEHDGLESSWSFDLPMRVRGTLGLAVACRGWPLRRSDQAWLAGRNQFDMGGPEGLGHRIRRWQQWADEQGLRIAGPRYGRDGRVQA